MSGGLGSRTTRPDARGECRRCIYPDYVDVLEARLRAVEQELAERNEQANELTETVCELASKLDGAEQQVKELQQQVEAAEAEAERIRRGGDVDRIHDLVHAIREADESASMVHDVIYAEPFDRAKASDGIWAIHAALRAASVYMPSKERHVFRAALAAVPEKDAG